MTDFGIGYFWGVLVTGLSVIIMLALKDWVQRRYPPFRVT
jgi:Mn2+/Fe2+ NRAMP family transporter